MRKTQDDELQLIVLVLKVRKKKQEKKHLPSRQRLHLMFRLPSSTSSPSSRSSPQAPEALCGRGDEGECKWLVG
jgi:hypothetical protein